MASRVDDRVTFYRRVLGDARYAERHRFPKWNVEPTVIMEPRLFPRVFPELTRADHARLAAKFHEKGLRVRGQYHRRIKRYIETFGEQGPLISAIGRGEHYPESVKEHLRILAHGASLLLDAAEAHKRAAKLRSLPVRDQAPARRAKPYRFPKYAPHVSRTRGQAEEEYESYARQQDRLADGYEADAKRQHGPLRARWMREARKFRERGRRARARAATLRGTR